MLRTALTDTKNRWYRQRVVTPASAIVGAHGLSGENHALPARGYRIAVKESGIFVNDFDCSRCPATYGTSGIVGEN